MRPGQLTLVRQVDPSALEDVLHLELKQTGIGEYRPINCEHSFPVDDIVVEATRAIELSEA